MIRKLFLLPIVLLVAWPFAELYAQKTPPSTIYSNSKPRNYVRVWDILAPITDPAQVMSRPVEDVRMSTSYMDGLGRPLQNVVREGSLQSENGTKSDVVTNFEYDIYGRDSYENLPFASIETNGNFKLNAFPQYEVFMGQQFGGQGESFYYGRNIYENSPLNRIEKTLAPGNNWVGNNRGIETRTWMNTSVDEVRIWKTTDNPGSFGTYTTNSVYPEGTLFKSVTVDEHQKQVIEFKDRSGKLILKKVQLSAPTDDGSGQGYTGWLCTYYVYDDYNNLRCVIQPRGVELLKAVVNWDLHIAGDGLANEQCFRYEYDQRDRMIMKKVPGADAVFMIYDARDRLVMTQDAKLRLEKKWLVTSYDDLNRPTATYLITDNTNYNNFGFHYFNAYVSSQYPDLSQYPSELLTQTAYDGYGTLNDYADLERNDIESNWLGQNLYSFPYPITPVKSDQIRGNIAWTKTKVLGSQSTYITTLFLYDDKGRVIQTKSQNHTGGIDINTNQYGWSGSSLVNVQKTQLAGATPQNYSVVTKNNYDLLWRLKEVTKSFKVVVNGSTLIDVPEKLIVSNNYDLLGRLNKKRLGNKPGAPAGTPLAVQEFEYNIRGWLLSINKNYINNGSNNDEYFGMQLGYDKNGTLSSFVPQYNGNISGVLWKSEGDQVMRKYDFNYDPANRLVAADFNQYAGGSGTSATFNKSSGIDFSERNITYDANGNISTLSRTGLKLNSSPVIDSLSYTYINSQGIAFSNKLIKVVDAVIGSDNGKLGDFKDGTNSTDDYNYDVNGNLTVDQNKSISNITYNHLNLPDVITVNGKGTITYIYDASGIKLYKQTVENGATVRQNNVDYTTTVTTSTNYLAGFVFESKSYSNPALASLNYTDRLQFTSHEEGRIRFSPASGTQPNAMYFDYMLKDHLGNVRTVLTEEVQTNAYPVASMEPAQEASESLYYTNINSSIRSAKPAGYPNDSYTNPNDYVAKLNGQSGNTKIGPAIVLKVMAGDKFNLRVNSWWKSAGGSPNAPSPLTELANALAGGIAGLSGGKVSAIDLANSGLTGSAATSFLNSQNVALTNRPRAFVNWVLLDENFNIAKDAAGNYIRDGYSNFQQVGDAEEFTTHSLVNAPISKNGYLYIYVSNQTPNMDVYFDNLQVTQIKGPILEETHYYPFGLTMTGISSKALSGTVPNKFKFNEATELEKNEFIDGSGLELYMTDFRNYDPQLGRFQTIDLLSEWALDVSPYVYALNNPILLNDPLGLVSDTTQRGFVNTATNCEVLPEVVVVGSKKPTETQSFLNAPLYLNNLPNTENFNSNGYRPNSLPNEIGLEKAPKVFPITQYSAAAGMTLFFTLLPLSAGPQNMPGGDEMYYLKRTSYFDPFPRPKPPFTNDNSSIILYRGVHAEHYDIANARKGMAVPWGGHSSVIDHNLGNNQSIFTSWTVYKNVAAKMAGRRGWGGVILAKRFKRSEVQLSFDKFMQGEVLVPGVVTGASVQNARPSK